MTKLQIKERVAEALNYIARQSSPEEMTTDERLQFLELLSDDIENQLISMDGETPIPGHDDEG